MNKTTWESTVKPVVVLSVISLVVSLLLAVVNSMTAPVIAENERATTLAAYVDVMPSVSDASTLEEVSGTPPQTSPVLSRLRMAAWPSRPASPVSTAAS